MSGLLHSRLSAMKLAIQPLGSGSPASSGDPSGTSRGVSGGAPLDLNSTRFVTRGETSGTKLKRHRLFLVPLAHAKDEDGGDVMYGESRKACLTSIGQGATFCVRQGCTLNHRGGS